MKFNHQRFSSFLIEGPSLDTTIRAIVSDANDPVTRVYEVLKPMARNFFHEHGTLRGFGIPAGGVGRRWYDAHYFNRMGKELYHLVQYAPKETLALKQFLSNLPKKFSDISASLPEALISAGTNLRNPALAQVGHKWKQERVAYQKYIRDLTGKPDPEESRVETDPNWVEPEDTFAAQSQQNATANDLVSRVLRDLPSNVAGDIRNAIARSPNKIQALQRELDKRGIRL